MDVADEVGVKMVFFHEVLEKLKYGEEITRVARYIIDRGHDLQLHTHVEGWNQISGPDMAAKPLPGL